MPNTNSVASTQDGISIRAYPGDGMVLLAFDLDEDLTQHLAGFALRCTPPNDEQFPIRNRLNFETKVTSETTPEQRVWTPSDQAPLQKFRWIHFPQRVVAGPYTYEVSAMYFGDGDLREGPSASVSVELWPPKNEFERFKIGFTRGYLSSQAYAERFNNAEFEPSNPTIDFDTAPYEKQYKWLGFDARQLVFDFLKECVDDEQITVDVFAYDLDEPDFIRALQRLGGRLRVFLDDADLHTKPGALEPIAKGLLERSAGKENVKTGHFRRFAHNKVIIQKRNGTPTKVLTGSANFSVRGLYAQANNVLVFDDTATATLYEEAFNKAFDDMGGFSESPIAEQWFDISGEGLPPSSVSFSPHRPEPHTSDSDGADRVISLDRVSQAIEGAKSSVMYAVMQLGGSGKVLEDLQSLGSRNEIFSYGITQNAYKQESDNDGITVYRPEDTHGIFTSFAYLDKHIPPPFQEEWRGGQGQVIHHKFVVVDFNDAEPVVFTGSSNLALRGEEENGDNLLAIYDCSVATAYAVEAIRLVDHYHFRAVMKDATSADPLMLKTDEAQWWKPYYDQNNAKYYERLLLSR